MARRAQRPRPAHARHPRLRALATTHRCITRCCLRPPIAVPDPLPPPARWRDVSADRLARAGRGSSSATRESRSAIDLVSLVPGHAGPN